MGKKLILSAILSLILLVLTVTYAAMEPSRQASATKRQLDGAVAKGLHTYAGLCMSCHGPQGEGVVGPPLNRPVYREGGPDELKGSAEVLREAIRAGRPGTTVPSTLRGADGSWISRTAMPTWSQEKGGPLTSQQIDDLVAFIQYGNFGPAQGAAPAPKTEGEFPTNKNVTPQVQEKAVSLLRGKGCVACHTVGSVGGVIGPDLTHVGAWRDATYLSNWIKAPDKMDRSNFVWSSGQKVGMGKAVMPAVPMTADELKTLVDYLSTLK